VLAQLNFGTDVSAIAFDASMGHTWGMDSETMLNVRIDEGIKCKFNAFCADAGTSASIAVNLFVHAVVREKHIPFDIAGNTDPFYGEKNQARLRQAMDQLEAGLGVECELIETGE